MEVVPPSLRLPNTAPTEYSMMTQRSHCIAAVATRLTTPPRRFPVPLTAFVLLISTLLRDPHAANAEGLIEADRVAEYHARNHTWPPRYDPPTPGWKAIVERRYGQVARILDRGQRYNGFVETTRSGVTTPNFTETGWGLTRAPRDLVESLRSAIREGVANGPRYEDPVEIIHGPQAWFIDRPDLTRRVLEELKPMHEQWSGVDLVGNNAYGFRLYRNSSELFMHVDKPDTHIISCILHIDRSEDSEPWPIIIEDFQGNTNEVILESGDILFYESSKCFHGRPKPFIGSWYSSIFVHYYPVGWDMKARRLNAHYAVPPHWAEDHPSTNQGGGGGESDCVDENEKCSFWASKGECSNNPRWMMDHCRKSCRSCLPDSVAQGGGGVESDCLDDNEKCRFWATKGECSNNPRWMLDHCRKSCGSCLLDSVGKATPTEIVDHFDRLQMEGTGMREPDCPDNWCAFRDGTVKWYGPGEEGVVISTTGKYPLGRNKKERRGSEL